MRSGYGVSVLVACWALGGCHQVTRAELDAKLQAVNASAQLPADMPRDAARKQISEHIAKIRTYPEFMLTQGIVNPRITEALISGPFTSHFFGSESTYYCVEYKLERPLFPQHVYLRAFPISVTAPKGTAKLDTIAMGREKECKTPYEAFPELERRRDDIIEFRKQHPGEMNDGMTIFGRGYQL